MTWKPPTSENAWAELLSAYLDGELPANEGAALKRALEMDPARARQLDAMRRLSSVLQEWTIESPPPAAQLLREVDRGQAARAARKRHVWLGRFRWAFQPRWRFATAVFLLGACAGVAGAHFAGALFQRRSPAAAPAPSPMVIVVSGDSDSTISPSQAERLLKEVLAAGAADRSRSQDRAPQDWENMAKTYRARLEERRAEPPDSAGAESGAWRTLREKYQRLKESQTWPKDGSV